MRYRLWHPVPGSAAVSMFTPSIVSKASQAEHPWWCSRRGAPLHSDASPIQRYPRRFSWPHRVPGLLINHLLGICPCVSLSQALQVGPGEGSVCRAEAQGSPWACCQGLAPRPPRTASQGPPGLREEWSRCWAGWGPHTQRGAMRTSPGQGGRCCPRS